MVTEAVVVKPERPMSPEGMREIEGRLAIWTVSTGGWSIGREFEFPRKFYKNWSFSCNCFLCLLLTFLKLVESGIKFGWVALELN